MIAEPKVTKAPFMPRRLLIPAAVLLLAVACTSCVVTNAITYKDYRPGGMQPDPTFLGAFAGGLVPGVGQLLNGEYLEAALYLGFTAAEVVLLQQSATLPDWAATAGVYALGATYLWSMSDSIGSYVSRYNSYYQLDSQFKAIPSSLKIEVRDFPTLYPALASNYAIEPVGSVTITNQSLWALGNFVVDIEFPGIMSEPHRLTAPVSLGIGQSATIDPTLILSGSGLTNAEASRVVGHVTARYRVLDRNLESSVEVPATLAAAGQIDLSDANRIAAFVTPNNAAVRQYARTAAQVVGADRIRALNGALESAGSLYTALQVNGFLSGLQSLAWKGTATTPSIHFPSQTLSASVGSALDVAVLYAALLESVGVGTALSVGPQDVAVLVDTGVAFADRATLDARVDHFVESGGRAWIPVLFRPSGTSPRDFYEAWDVGARSFPASRPIVVSQTAWTRFRPAADQQTAGAAAVIDAAKLRDAYVTSRAVYIDSRLAVDVGALEQRLATSDSATTRNKIMLAYARFGRYAEALAAAEKGIALYSGNLPLLTNKANVLAMSGRAPEAADLVQGLLQNAALKIADAQRFDLLVFLAKIRFETREYDKAAESFRTAARLDPKRASPFGYLASAPAAPTGQDSGSARGSAADAGFVPQWADEESANAQ